MSLHPSSASGIRSPVQQPLLQESSFLDSDTKALQSSNINNNNSNSNNSNNGNVLLQELSTTMADEKVSAEVAKKRSWSDTLFPPLGISVTFWHQGPIDLTSWCLTLACLVAAMCKDPTDSNGERTRDVTIRWIEIGLSAYFMIEWILRAVLLGLGDGTASYFRWLDFLFSTACATLHVLFFAGVGSFNIELLVARSIRLFRPFVRVTNMPAVRVFLTSMTRAIIRGASVIVLFVFFLAWFGAAGSYEFGGALHARCVSNAFFENNTNITAFVQESRLSVVDFVCGSAFFRRMDEFRNFTGFAALMALPYSDTFFHTLSCSSDQTCVYPRDVPTYGGFICPYNYTCLQVGDNPYHNVIGFDNFFQSGLTLFVSTTFQVWYELEGWIADTGDPGAHWFFLILLLIGGFMIVNVTTVVLSIEFEASTQEEKRSIAEQMSGVSSSRAALQNVVRTISASQKRNRRRQELKAKSAASGGGAGGSSDAATDANGGDGTNADGASGSGGGGFAAVLAAAAKKGRGGGGGRRRQAAGKSSQQVRPSLADWQNDQAWRDAADQSPVHAARGGAGVLAYEEEMKLLGGSPSSVAVDFRPPAPRKIGVQEFIKHRIVKTKLFQLVTGFVVFANCIQMASDSFGNSRETQLLLYNLDIFFTAFYVFEYLVRFTADGPIRAMKKVSLLFDLLIAILSIIDLIPTLADFPGVRAFRVVRLVKLLKFFPSLYEWIIVVAVAIKTSPVLIVVMAVVQISFACICMSILGNQFCGLDAGNAHLFSSWTPDQSERERIIRDGGGNESFTLGADGECFMRPRATFDTLGDALITAYQISTADDWDLIMYDAMRARGWWIAILFLGYFYMITYLILNQIIAILLTANKQQDDLQFTDGVQSGEDPLKRLERLEAEAREADKKKKEEEQAAREMARQVSADGNTVPLAEGEDDDDDDDDDDEYEDDDEGDDDDEASEGHGSSSNGAANDARNQSPSSASATAAAKNNSNKRKKKRKLQQKNRKWKAKKDERTLLSRAVEVFFNFSDTTKEWSRALCANHRFQWFMSFVIVVGSLSMAFETPELAPDSPTTLFLADLDIIITSLYVFELVISVHAYGLIRRPTSYLQRDPWNGMDALLVVISLIGLFSSSVRGNSLIRVFRILRAVRPLRVVKRSPGMRLVLSSLIGSATQMANVFVLSFIFFFVFAIIGMQFFAGSLQRCYVGTQLFENLPLENCTAMNGTYTMPAGTPAFDNFGQAVGSLFLVATLESWAGLMYSVMDSPGPQRPPLRGSNPVAAPYFIASSFLLGFFIAGFFVSVLIDAYNREKRQASLNKSLLVLREQEAWLMTARRIARVLPHDDRHLKYDDDSCAASINRALFDFRLRARNFVESPLFQNAVSFLVLCNFIMMAAVTYPALPYNAVLELLDDVFVFVWVIEAIIKIYALTWRAYAMSTWNKLDFVIMLVSLLSYILAPFFNRRALALVRVVRVLRLLRIVQRYTKVTSLIRMMGRAFLSLGHVLTFIFLVFFIFAVAGMNLFGRVNITDRHSNFRSLGSALFLLLRITLGGNWIDLFLICSAEAPFCDDDIGQCGLPAPVPQLYFYFFLFLATFILKNLFTAVMLDAFTSGGNLRSITSDDAKNFYTVWKKFDEDDAFMIHPFDTLPLLREIPLSEPAILGFAADPRRVRVGKEFKFLIALEMLSVHDPVPIERFVDTLLSFAYAAPLSDSAKLERVREGSSHIIDPKLIESGKQRVAGVIDEIKDMMKDIASLSKMAYTRFKRAAVVICADLAGVEPPPSIREDDDAKSKSALGDVEMKDKPDESSSSNLQRSMRRGSMVPVSALSDEQRARFARYDPLAQPSAEDEKLTDEEIFSRTASYVMINTLIMRRRQLMREQIRLNERIALRKFDQMGLRAIRGHSIAGQSPLSNQSFGQNPVLLHSSPSVAADPGSLARTASMHQNQGQQQQQEQQQQQQHHHQVIAMSPTSLSSPSNRMNSSPLGTHQQHNSHTAHHDEWVGGNKDAAFSPREMALRRAGINSKDNTLMLRISPGAHGNANYNNNPNNNNNNTSFASKKEALGVPHNLSGLVENNNHNNNYGYFNTVCSYFAVDERGIFNAETDRVNGSAGGGGGSNKKNSPNKNNTFSSQNNDNNSSNSNSKDKNTMKRAVNSNISYIDDDDDEHDSGHQSPPRAFAVEKAPSLVYNVLQLIDDLYNLAHHTLKHDSFNHSVELARCFVELEWWSEAMCDAVRDLPDDRVDGVDVAIALLPDKAGMQALTQLHDDLAEGIDRMQLHYEQLIKSDAKLELDWFKMYMQQHALPFDEVCLRYPEMVRGRSESVFIPLLAKSYPTLELIGHLVPQLDGNREVDPTILFQAADTAIRKQAVWFSIVSPSSPPLPSATAAAAASASSSSNQPLSILAHCEPDYVQVFHDAVTQSTRFATGASPRWKDVLARVGMRAPTSSVISNFVPAPVKRYLQDMTRVFDWYHEAHRAVLDATIQNLEQLADMRIQDLKENQDLVAKQNHQVQQLRLCLQLLEQTYSDRELHSEPSSGLQFADDVATSQHPKKATVVASLVHAIVSTKVDEGERSAAYDVAHAAELTHDCARKALHSLLENIPRDMDDSSISASIQRTQQPVDGDFHGENSTFNSSHNNNSQHQYFGLGGMLHDDSIGTSKFASECLTAVSRLAAAVASEPAVAATAMLGSSGNESNSIKSDRGNNNNNDDTTSSSNHNNQHHRAGSGGGRTNQRSLSPDGSGANLSPDGEPPDAATTRLQSVVSAATGPEFRAKLNLLVETGVVAYVLRAMPHVAERQLAGTVERKNVGLSQLNNHSAVVPQHAVAPPKRLWLRLSRTMDMLELRQALTSSDNASSVVARIPLTSILRLDGDTVGAAQSFGRSAANAWPFLGSALQGARAMRFIVDTRKFSSNKIKSGSPQSSSGGGSSRHDPPASSAAAPLSLMMPHGEGHDSVPNSHERSIVVALPQAVVYGEWLSLLRDVIRQRRLLPVLYASRADQIREKLRDEDKLFKFRSVVQSTIAASRLHHAFSAPAVTETTPTGDIESASSSSQNFARLNPQQQQQQQQQQQEANISDSSSKMAAATTSSAGSPFLPRNQMATALGSETPRYQRKSDERDEKAVSDFFAPSHSSGYLYHHHHLQQQQQHQHLKPSALAAAFDDI